MFTACGVPRERSGAERPNIVFILADDLGYGDLGCYGAADIRTPFIDGFAAEGVRFTQFYSNGSECTPTRAAFLTGRYQQRVGGLECAIGTGGVGRYDDAVRLQAAGELGLPTSEISIARLLREAGYATAICGKWHLGYDDKFSPVQHGFDYAFYSLGGGMDYFHHVEDPPAGLHVLRLNERPVERRGYFTDLIADEAARFIERQAGRPFFLYVPFTAPHSPYQGPGDYRPEPLPASSPLWNQAKAPPKVYAAMVERMDEAVGRILKALDERGIARNTLVVFTSDNGGTASARPTRYSGIKGGLFEGGIRVPCLARWPGVLRPGTVTDRIAITMDLTASFLRVAGAAQPEGRPFDGIDILHEVERNIPPVPRVLFWRARRGDRTWRAVREGPLKYVSRKDGADSREFLFDVERDPAESRDLSAERPADRERLKSLLVDWESRVRPSR